MRSKIITYRDDDERPQARLALANGDRIVILLDRGGVTISQTDANPKILFQAGPEVTSRLCASFVDPQASPAARPLQILAAIVLQFDSAHNVASAFREASAQIS